MPQKKYEIIQAALSSRIRQGLLSEGAKLPTETALSREYSVSRLTVRQALSGLARQGLVRSVQGSGTYVKAGHQHFSGTLRTFHCLLNNDHSDLRRSRMLSLLVLYLADGASKSGYTMSLSLLPKHQNFTGFVQENGFLPTFSGGILSSPAFTATELELLQREHIPHISLHQPLPDAPCPHVGNDLDGGIGTCIDQLVSFGHRRIGIIVEEVRHRNLAAAALARHGLELPDSAVAFAAGVNDQGGATAVMDLLHRCPELTGLMIFGDQASAGAMHKLLDCGIRIPTDLSVAVLDRYEWMDTILPFRPSGTQQDLEGIAYEILRLFQEQRDSGAYPPRQINLQMNWIAGESIGFPRTQEKLHL